MNSTDSNVFTPFIYSEQLGVQIAALAGGDAGEAGSLLDGHLLAVSHPDARALLTPVTHIYSDLDGTLFAPGGKLLADHSGKASIATAQALVALRQADIEVIIATGRSGTQGHELLRILNLQTFIGELGCVVLHGFGAKARLDYLFGEWQDTILSDEPGLAPGELPAGVTPYELIVKDGVVDRLLTAFPGKIEPHTPYPDERRVTHAFRGFVDADEAAALLARERLPLHLSDNGQIHPQVHSLVDCPEIHAYHLMPRGISKALAVDADIRQRELERTCTLAIGDAAGDLDMGTYTGAVVMTGNALKSPTVQQAIVERANRGNITLYTVGHTADGWVEFARALLGAQG